MKKFFVSTIALLTLTINISPVSADENVEIFGGEFDDNVSSNAEIDDVLSNPPVEVSVPNNPPAEVSVPNNPPEVDEDNFGDELNFDNLRNDDFGSGNTDNSYENENFNSDFENVENTTNETVTEITTPPPSTEKKSSAQKASSTKQTKLKTQKARFVKLTMDETYYYYLDKQTVSWKRMPYSTTEFMADVWIRMIERNDDYILPESEVDEIVFAKEEGKQFLPVDVEVLKHGKYHLEHYYLRPKTEQIQFLCELSDIEGRPQNTISERSYSYQNWEYLVPSSIESRIYHAVIKVIGKGRASADAPVTFADYLEEYARISIR